MFLIAWESLAPLPACLVSFEYVAEDVSTQLPAPAAVLPTMMPSSLWNHIPNKPFLGCELPWLQCFIKAAEE